MKFKHLESFISGRLKDHHEERNDSSELWEHISDRIKVEDEKISGASVKYFGIFLATFTILFIIWLFLGISGIPEVGIQIDPPALSTIDRTTQREKNFDETQQGNLESITNSEYKQLSSANPKVKSKRPAANKSRLAYRSDPLTYIDEVRLTSSNKTDVIVNSIETSGRSEVSQPGTIEKELTKTMAGDDQSDRLVNTISSGDLLTQTDRPRSRFWVLPLMEQVNFHISEGKYALGAWVPTPRLKIGLERQGSWLLQMCGGINYQTLGLSNKSNMDYFEKYQQSQLSELGQHAGVEIKYVRPNGLMYGTGFMFSRDWIRFKAVTQRSGAVLKQNVLLQVMINAVSRDTIGHVYGDTLLNQSSIRTVVHHNVLDHFTIPVEIGLLRSSGCWNYGGSIGVRLNFLTYQKGRIFASDQDVTDFSNGDSVYRKFSTSVYLRPNLGYQFSSKLGIFLMPSVGLSLGDRHKIPNITSRPINLYMTVGMSVDLSK